MRILKQRLRRVVCCLLTVCMLLPVVTAYAYTTTEVKGLDQYVGMVNELSEGQVLKAGSMVLTTTSGTYVTMEPLFYVKDSDDYMSAMFTTEGVTDSMALRFSKVIFKLGDEYHGQNVWGWKIVEIRQTNDDIEVNRNPPYGYVDDTKHSEHTYKISNDWGTTQTDYEFTGYRSGYVQYVNYMLIQVEPIYQLLTIKNPTVSTKCYYLSLETAAPEDYEGNSRPDLKPEIENKFYVTPDTTLTVDDINPDDMMVYDDAKDYILHPGTYRVFTDAAYTDSSGTTYTSGIAYEDITIEPPIVEDPDIEIDEESYTVSYGKNGIHTELGKTDYTYRNIDQNQKLIRFHTTDPDYEYDKDQMLQDGEKIDFDDVTDNLYYGYNKVFAHSAFTIPESMLGDPAVTYYSDGVSEEIYRYYELEVPVITESIDVDDITLDYGGDVSRSLRADIKYVYCDILDDTYSDFSSSEMESVSNSALYQDNIRPIPKTDGISKVYAISCYEEAVHGITYTSYSGVGSKICTKRYIVNNVAVSASDIPKITLSSGGYSSDLKAYDTSVIYYQRTDDEPETVTIESLMSDGEVYSEPFDGSDGGWYLTTAEVITSEWENAQAVGDVETVSFISHSQVTTTYIPKTPAIVTFGANGGTCSVRQKEVYKDEEYGDLPQAVRDKHVFLGWFTETNNGTQITENSIKQDKNDETLYAHWREFCYKIKFDANGGEGTMDEQVLQYSDSAALRKNAFERSGYQFEGWNVDKDAVLVKYEDCAVVLGLVGEDNGVVTLYAIWQKSEDPGPNPPDSDPDDPPSDNPDDKPSGDPDDPPSDNPDDKPSGDPDDPPSGNPDDKPSGDPDDPPSGNPDDKPSGNPDKQKIENVKTSDSIYIYRYIIMFAVGAGFIFLSAAVRKKQ